MELFGNGKDIYCIKVLRSLNQVIFVKYLQKYLARVK